jgi:hypothetical protein
MSHRSQINLGTASAITNGVVGALEELADEFMRQKQKAIANAQIAETPELKEWYHGMAHGFDVCREAVSADAKDKALRARTLIAHGFRP